MKLGLIAALSMSMLATGAPASMFDDPYSSRGRRGSGGSGGNLRARPALPVVETPKGKRAKRRERARNRG